MGYVIDNVSNNENSSYKFENTQKKNSNSFSVKDMLNNSDIDNTFFKNVLNGMVKDGREILSVKKPSFLEKIRFYFTY